MARPPCDDRGTVVVDGFAVYEVLARDGLGLVLAHCWAHTKRKYEDIADQWPIACAEIRALIGELYAIERLVPGPFQAMPRHRGCVSNCERSDRVRSSFASGNGPRSKSGLPRSDFGKAVRYMLKRWAGLTRFVEDPRIPLDNNAALRGPVVGRKNHYGSRSLRGTEVAAAFYTLCETARLVGVDPRAYLLRAVYAAIGRPGTVTFPEDLLASTLTG